MRVWCVGLVMLLVSLAGCVEAADDEADDETDPTLTASGPQVLPWSLEACRAIVAVLPAERDAVQPLLPEGFTPMSMEELLGTGTDTGAAGEANFGIEAFECASGTGLNGSVDEMTYGSYFIGVHPPEELVEDVTYHFVKLDTLVPDQDRRAFLQAHGIPAVEGSADAAYTVEGVVGGRVEANLQLGDVRHVLEATGVQYLEPGGSFIEFTETPNGLAAWRAAFTWSTVFAGPATVDVAAGSTAADVLGSGPVQGAAFLGTISFHDASLTLPDAGNATAEA